MRNRARKPLKFVSPVLQNVSFFRTLLFSTLPVYSAEKVEKKTERRHKELHSMDRLHQDGWFLQWCMVAGLVRLLPVVQS